MNNDNDDARGWKDGSLISSFLTVNFLREYTVRIIVCCAELVQVILPLVVQRHHKGITIMPLWCLVILRYHHHHPHHPQQ